MEKLRNPLLAALGAILSWSSVATLFKLALAQMTWFALLTVAITCSAVIFIIIALCQGKFKLLRTIPRKEFLGSAAMGMLNPTLYYIALFTAYDMLPAQIALSLNYTWPIVFLIILSVAHRTLPSTRQIVGLLLSFAGIICTALYGSGGTTPALGMVIALISAILWALYWLLNIRRSSDATLSLAISFTASAVILNIAALVMGVETYGSGVQYALSVGCFEMSIPFLLWGYALKHGKNKALINQLSYLAPILSLLIINFILGESVALTTIIGACCIITGIIITQKEETKETPKEA